VITPVELVVITRRDHPDIKKPLDLETFHRLPHIGLRRELRGLTNVDQSLSASTMPRRVCYMASKMWSVPAMVERTDLVGMLPRAFVKQILGKFDLDVHELPAKIPDQHLYMMWHTNSEHDPGHIWLRQTMMQALKSPQPASLDGPVPAAAE
jgi:DNA-binding transcriptional LysR family regulator